MRKIFGKLFAMTIIASVLTIALCFVSLMYNDSYNAFSATETIYDQATDAGGDTPSAGEFLAIFGTIAITADIASAIAYAFLIIIIPGFILLTMAALQLIALLFQLGEEKRWKLITGKVLTYTTAILQVFVCLVLLFNIFCNKAANIFILIGILIFNIIFTVFFIKNLIKIKIPEKTVLN